MRTLFKIIYALCLTGLIFIGSLLLLTAFPIPGVDLDARVVRSGSMEPAIPTGSVIFIMPAEEYTVGDIITYRIVGMDIPTTHRIVGIDEDDKGSFITKGDANPADDILTVDRDDILGSVRFHIPFLGFVINLARQPLGFFLLIIFPALVIGVDEIRRIFRDIEKKKEDDGKERSLKRKVAVPKVRTKNNIPKAPPFKKEIRRPKDIEYRIRSFDDKQKMNRKKKMDLS